MSTEKIKISSTKILTIVFAMILTTSMLASAVLIQTTSAHTPGYQIPTYAYIEANPNPIGVGQTATVFMWINQIFGVGYDTVSYAQLSNNYRFHNYNLTVINPDGTSNSTIFSYISDPTSNQITTFTPSAVGNYTFIFNFPGQAYNQYGYLASSILVNDTYLPSSATTTLEVTQTPINNPIGSSPLPTEYWTRPIYGENTNWFTITSNWLGTGSPVSSATGSGPITPFSTGPPSQSWGSVMERYPGDAVGPLTSHVMWTMPLESGGVVGGNNFPTQGVGYFEGSAYEQRFTNPIIMDGILYFTEPITFTGTASGPTVAVNLQTGQILWSSTQIPALSFGYVYDLYDPNQHGVYPPILFTSNFARAFDGFTGDPLFNVTGVPSGYLAMGPNGEQLRYVLTNNGNATNPNWYLAEWNSSRIWDTTTNPWTGAADNAPTLYNDSTTAGASLTTAQSQYASVTQPALGAVAGTNNNAPATSNYIVYANVVNPSSPLYSYDWNYSVPSMNSPTATNAPVIVAGLLNNVLLVQNGTQPASPGSFTGTGSYTPYTYYALNLNSANGQIGSLLWAKTLQPPAGNVTVYYAGVDPTTNVFVEANEETLSFVGYSLTSGNQVWTTINTPLQAFDYYGQPGPSEIYAQLAYGNLYTSGYGGTVYCFNDSTGALQWTYGNGPFGGDNSTLAELNTPYGDYPTYINAVGNGVIYLVTTEHTITDPIYKGCLARAINATTGQQIWTLSDYTGEFVAMSYAMADGYATFLNGYDMQVYSVGQGPSATTVTAPSAGLASGQSVVISGTVMDVSAGTQQVQQKADFPTGVPVASDASMGDWMGYVYQQQPIPTNFVGVPVQVYVLDSNGNHRQIGTATTDTSGTYHLTWTPDISGNYTVYAQFAGTKGYWPSSAETAFNVMQAPSSTPTPTSSTGNLVTTADLLTYMAVAVILILIAIVVVGVLLLRKRP